MLSDDTFKKAALDTVIWLILFGGISACGGLEMALLLQPERRGVGFYRAAMFHPGGVLPGGNGTDMAGNVST